MLRIFISYCCSLESAKSTENCTNSSIINWALANIAFQYSELFEVTIVSVLAAFSSYQKCFALAENLNYYLTCERATIYSVVIVINLNADFD